MLIVFLFILAGAMLLLFVYFFVGKAKKADTILWGVNFSQMQAENLKLDWKKTYLAVMEDLGVKHIKLMTQWDWVEGAKDEFYFADIDWQVKEAQKHGAKLIYVTGMKTGRWPECHVPDWANGLSKSQQQDEILAYVKEVVLRYKDSPAIIAWQAENEPLFKFGECPWYDKEFLKKEVALIKSLDPGRPVVISDSGEQSFWFDAAQIGDVVSPTMYRKLWFHITDKFGFYGTFPLPPLFYHRKAQLIEYLFNKKVICGELQAEPWAFEVFYDVPLEEQEKTMNLEKFKESIEYAKSTGLDTFYLWGAEWWFWLKETQDKPEIWNNARDLFNNKIQ